MGTAKKKTYNLGNNHARDHANAIWLHYAWANGWDDENHMWYDLRKDWSHRALADLFGVSGSTIGRRMKKCGVKSLHGFGGRNHRMPAKRQTALMKRMHDFCHYVFKLEWDRRWDKKKEGKDV